MSIEKQFIEIKKIDDVLKYLAKDRGHSNFDDILAGLNKKFGESQFNGDELLRILNKLEKEEYIIPIVIDPTTSSGQSRGNKRTYYAISWDGRFFIENGGYLDQKNNEIEERRVRREIEDEVRKNSTRQLELQNQLNLLTIIVAIGAIIGSIYYVQEIVKFYIDFNANNIQKWSSGVLSFIIILVLIYFLFKDYKTKK